MSEQANPHYRKSYVGDGVYIECDGYDFILTVSNGIHTTNTIIVDLDMIKIIADYARTASGATI